MSKSATAKYEDIEQEALDIVRMFWLISEGTYDELRKIDKDCEKSFGDLPATTTDNPHIRAMAKRMGVTK